MCSDGDLPGSPVVDGGAGWGELSNRCRSLFEAHVVLVKSWRACAVGGVCVIGEGYADWVELSHRAVDGWNRYWQHSWVALPARLSPEA
jgi:hypothetical protein